MAEKRLIDAVALRERIKKNCLACTPGSFAEQCYMDAITSVNEAPTIDPESLRGHAKWVKSKERVVIVTDGPDDCHEEPAIVRSHCDAVMSQSEYDLYVWKFCPVCGFSMEDGTEEET